MEDPYREDAPQLPVRDELSEPELPAPAAHKRGLLGILVKLGLFVVLFLIGIWLSSYLRQFLSSAETASPVTPEPTIVITPTPVDPYDGWRVYQVVSSNNRPITGVTVKIPSEVLSPVCDGSSCISQGTYLPGGTRLTIAMRGVGQILPNPKGAILTDASGKQFSQRETTATGFGATEFSADIAGTTVGGYAFNKIRGYMIYLTSTLVMEISHFSPSGVKTDFLGDEAVFEKIVQTMNAVNLSIVPCAGTTSKQCPAGYACKLDTPNVPTGGGHCVPVE